MNPKTVSDPRKPERIGRYVRKYELDEYEGRNLPLPTQVVSNEEFAPIAQTSRQQAVEQHILATAERNAKKLGTSRREFLRSACGMAASFAALNSVFGPFFTVNAAELLEVAAAAAKEDFFIFDVQTHHVATPSEAPRANQAFLRSVVGMRRMARRMPSGLKGDPSIEEAHRLNYIKEVFLDSETDVALISALPTPSEEVSVLPPDVMQRTESWVNELTSSRRVLTHGYFWPEMGKRALESMQVQREKHPVAAWKGYTGTSVVRGREGWMLDDEKITYPALEFSRKLGVKNVCVHKGLPFPGTESYWHPRDLVKVSRDFPDFNFLVYHSGFKGVEEALPAAEDGFKKSSYIPWVSDLCEWRRKNPHMKNVYMELGSTFGLMVVSSPPLAAHVLGMIIQAFGEEGVLWGTDSIWWGSPRWQIEAFRRFEMPDELMRRFGYKPLTTETKRKIFGLNSARIYGVDIRAMRNPVPVDYIDRLRKKYKEIGATPSNAQYGWVAA
ncbi:MAG TPA: amidohydrolase family protein [Terriglobales bacterium]|nr:amidohydrolase family protein [Terriglobales bacterium]